MTTTRRVALTVLLAAASAACGGPEPPPPPPPTVVVLTLRGTPDMNPDGSGSAKPLRVRIFQLKSPQALAATDFFTLDPDPAAILKGDLVAAEERFLVPGTEQTWQATLDPAVTTIAVVGSYFDVDRAAWRAWTGVPPNMTTNLVATASAAGITLEGGSP